MNALDDRKEEDVCVFLTLDDACLAAILGNLSAQQVRAAAAVCKRLLAISSADSLWIKHIRDTFGLCLSTVKGAQRVPGAALELYNRLQKAKQLPHALPAQALCTDGGCDEPFDSYWAGNMFSNKRAALYCSEADTRNIHVFARLCPPKTSTGSPQEQQQQPAEEQQQQQQQQQQPAEEHTQFLLGRCAQAARHLINQRVVDTYEQQSRHMQQLQQQLSAAGRWRSLTRLVWERVRPADKLGAATAALQSCSTEGLAEFFVAAYMGQQQYASWARSLFSNLNDEQIAHVHEVAFQMWSEMMEPPARHSFLLLPASPQPALLSNASAPAAAAAAAGSGPSNSAPGAATAAAHGASLQQQQQQRRRLLCAADQLTAFCGKASSAEGTYIVQECILARDGMGGSTCPIRSGFIFLGHHAGSTPADHSTSLLQAGSSSSSNGGDLLLRRPAGEDAVRAAAAGEQADGAVKALATDLSGMVHQPWLAAAQDLTSAAAVHTASRAGLLPPVIDYVLVGSGGGGGGAEYIEFAAPSPEQLRQQQQEWAALRGGSSSRGSAGGEGAWPAGGLLAPVLWFRFHDAAGGSDDEDEDEDDDEDENEGEEVDSEEEAAIEAAAAAATAAINAAADVEEAEQDVALGQGSSSSSSSSSSMSTEGQEAEEEGSSMSPGDGNHSAGQPQQQHQQQQQQEQQGAAVAMEEDQPALLQVAAAGQQAVPSGSAADSSLVPRVVTPSASMLCTAAPELPVVATEVSAALGWQPAAGHAGMLAVQLLQPRSANFVCALLLDCEDAKPAFNRSRGGCNIDMQLVMLRGHPVGQLPVGLQMAAPGQ